MTHHDDRPGEYTPAGEAVAPGQTFSVAEIAAAFGVSPVRVERAIAGEFGAAVTLDDRAVQHLAEVLLVDKPLAERQAALMELGAFTPRADHDTGLGEKDPTEESDRLVRNSDRGDGERGD